MILAQEATSQPARLFVEMLVHSDGLLKFYGLTAGFLLTLYALFTRDNELRLSHRELFRVLVGVLVAFLLQCFVWVLYVILGWKQSLPIVLSCVALLCYMWAVFYLFFRVTVLSYLRVEKFKERPFLSSFKHLPVVRRIVQRISTMFEKHYETNVGKRCSVPAYKQLNTLIGHSPEMHNERGMSLLATYNSLHAWLTTVATLVDEHLDNGETVTIITCRHHPAHILSYIEKCNGVPNEDKLKRFAVVDAFTLSFGGDDEVFHKSLYKKKEDGYTIIPARSLAGIHSGAAEAFKLFKKARKGPRQPATIIYDGLLSYQYCEPTDHINRFLTHMVEAERAYAMITIIGEPEGVTKAVPYAALSAMVDYTANEVISDPTKEQQ